MMIQKEASVICFKVTSQKLENYTKPQWRQLVFRPRFKQGSFRIGPTSQTSHFCANLLCRYPGSIFFVSQCSIGQFLSCLVYTE